MAGDRRFKIIFDNKVRAKGNIFMEKGVRFFSIREETDKIEVTAEYVPT